VRPTPDRLRESLFNVLAPQISGVTFVDAYAGTGAVGIEALSRGARHVILIERSLPALETIRENVRMLGIEGSVSVVRGSAARLLASYRADIVFLDPPYDRTEEYEKCLTAAADGSAKLVLAQHSSRVKLNENYGELAESRVLKQGDNWITFYSRPG
jgi:16S rRNA (guanine(966)-N(2))-methyltransferase RsmD